MHGDVYKEQWLAARGAAAGKTKYMAGSSPIQMVWYGPWAHRFYRRTTTFNWLGQVSGSNVFKCDSNLDTWNLQFWINICLAPSIIQTWYTYHRIYIYLCSKHLLIENTKHTQLGTALKASWSVLVTIIWNSLPVVMHWPATICWLPSYKKVAMRSCVQRKYLEFFCVICYDLLTATF